MRKLLLIVAIAAMTVLATAGAAFAAHSFQGNPDNLYDNGNTSAYGAESKCIICHSYSALDATGAQIRTQTRTSGPHGGYTTTTRRCATCHVIHSNVGDNGRVGESQKLLPGSTVTGVCAFCHDLTGSENSAYATYYMTDPATEVKSAHYVEGMVEGEGMYYYTGYADNNYNAPSNGPLSMPSAKAWGDAIPGGNQATGGTLAYDGLFNEGDWSKNSTKQFTCDSCHTPHAITGQTVAPFFGENPRRASNADAGKTAQGYAGNRLLKAKLTVGGATYAQYGSAWCAGCHMGRLTMAGDNANHPVNTGAAGYDIGKIATLTTGRTTPFQVYGGATAAQINAGVAVGSASANNFATIVQYGTAAYSGTTNANGTILVDANRFMSAYPRLNSWYTMTSGDALENNAPRPDGYIPISNFQSPVSGVNGPACQQCHAAERNVEDSFMDNDQHFTFPHIGTSAYLLVEQNTDDLCTNCHGLDNLP